MDKTKEIFEKIVAPIPKGKPGHFGYGNDVMPVISLYKELESSLDAPAAFVNALAKMLRNRDKKVRDFAVWVCIGFFAFRHCVLPRSLDTLRAPGAVGKDEMSLCALVDLGYDYPNNGLR